MIATFTNAEYGTAATVSGVIGRYVVEFLDTDADAVITIRIFPDANPDRALAYAEGVVTGARP